MKTLSALTLLLTLSLSTSAQMWKPVDIGTNNGNNGGIELQSYNGKLYAGGAFSVAGSVPARGVAMYDGNKWSIVDNTNNNFFAVRPLIVYRGVLYGFADDVVNTKCYLMRLDNNSKWQAIPGSSIHLNTYQGSVFSSCVYKDELYIAGNFDSIPGLAVQYIARWNGTEWKVVGSGINDSRVNEMKVYKDKLYVGGRFTFAGGIWVNNLASWDGNQWTDVGGGTDDGIRCMEVFQDELYIGGDFEEAGGNPMVHITKWNGSIFSDVDGGLAFAGVPSSLKSYANKLHFGGLFKSTGLFQNNSGTWDGSKYSGLGTGINAWLTDFEIFNCQLYAGGYFHDLGKPNGVAVLDMIDCGSAGIDHNNLNATQVLSISPNPFCDYTVLRFATGHHSSKIIIRDVYGKLIREILFSGRELTLEKGELKAGVYFLNLQDENNSFITTKLIVQ